jgi:hypothetical protein
MRNLHFELYIKDSLKPRAKNTIFRNGGQKYLVIQHMIDTKYNLTFAQIKKDRIREMIKINIHSLINYNH